METTTAAKNQLVLPSYSLQSIHSKSIEGFFAPLQKSNRPKFPIPSTISKPPNQNLSKGHINYDSPEYSIGKDDLEYKICKIDTTKMYYDLPKILTKKSRHTQSQNIQVYQAKSRNTSLDEKKAVDSINIGGLMSQKSLKSLHSPHTLTSAKSIWPKSPVSIIRQIKQDQEEQGISNPGSMFFGNNDEILPVNVSSAMTKKLENLINPTKKCAKVHKLKLTKDTEDQKQSQDSEAIFRSTKQIMMLKPLELKELLKNQAENRNKGYRENKFLENIKVYQRNKDTITHIDHSCSSSPVPSLGNFGGKKMRESPSMKYLETRDKKNQSIIERTLNRVSILNSSDLDSKRSSDKIRSRISTLKTFSPQIKGSPLMIPNRLTMKRDSSAISVLENISCLDLDDDPTGKMLPSLNLTYYKGNSSLPSNILLNNNNTRRIKIYDSMVEIETGTRNENHSPKEKEKDRKSLFHDQFQLVKNPSAQTDKSAFEKITEEKEPDLTPEAKPKVFEMEDGFEIKQKKVSKGNKKKAENKIVQWLPEEAEELHDQLNDLMIRVDQYANIMEEKGDNKLIEAPVSVLEEADLKIIRTEYRKTYSKTDNIDYEKLDGSVSKLSFFSTLPDKLRKKVLRCSAYSYFPANTIIHRRIDREDQIYVLLRGSIQIKTMKTVNDKQEKRAVAILSPGAHFGEYSQNTENEEDPLEKRLPHKVCTQMGAIDLETGEETTMADQKKYYEQIIINQKMPSEFVNFIAESETPLTNQEQKAKEQENFEGVTVEVAQTCELICIQRDKLDNLLNDPSEKVLNAKIKLILNLNIFKTIDHFGLIPLADKFATNMYSMGEIIIPMKADIDKFRIIAQGRCKIIKRVERLANSQELERYQKRKKIPKENSAKKKRLRKRAKSESNREVDEEKVEVRQGKLYIIEHVVYGTLGIGDSFGGRALLSEADFVDDGNYAGKRYLGPARLSVVADSPCVEILELDREQANLVPQFLMKPLKKKYLREAREFDEEWRDYDILELAPQEEV